MKKFKLIAGLIGLLAGAPYSTDSEAITRRKRSIPIKQVQQYDNEFCEDPWKANLKENWAKYNIDVHEEYVNLLAWGVHKKQVFCYHKKLRIVKEKPLIIEESTEELNIRNQKFIITIVNEPSVPTYEDIVRINGIVRDRGHSGYFETPLPYKPWKKMNPIEKAHRILHKWYSRIGTFDLEGRVIQAIETHRKKLDTALDGAR